MKEDFTSHENNKDFPANGIPEEQIINDQLIQESSFEVYHQGLDQIDVDHDTLVLKPLGGQSNLRADSQERLPVKTTIQSISPNGTPLQTKQVTLIELEAKVQYRTSYGFWIMVVLMFLISLSAVLWRGGAIEWLLLSTSSFFIVSSGLIPWLAALSLQLDRQIETGLVSEGEISAKLTLRRKTAMPGVWYGVTERYENKSKLEQNIVLYRMIFTPFFHKSMTAHYLIRQLPRGSYEALPTEIIIGDWLGITCIKRKLELPKQVTILPQKLTTTEGSFLHSLTTQRWQNEQSVSQKRSVPFSLNRQNSETSLSAKSFGAQGGNGDATRPYIEGEDYRRIDKFAAARGRGLHTRLQAQHFEQPPFCIVLDQYGAAFQGIDKDLLFESMISWGLHDVLIEGREQIVSVVTDDWNFEYSSENDELELRCLLAMLRADVKQRMKARLPQLSALLPSKGHIRVYSGDWREEESWSGLAELAWLKGSTVEMHFVTTSRVMTYGMREIHRKLEQTGLKVVWRYCSSEEQQQLEYVMEGEEHYASS